MTGGMELARYITGTRQIAGIEVILHAGAPPEIYVALLSRSGNKVRFVRGESGITSFIDLKQKLPGDIPIALCVSGTGVIHRKITQPLPAGTHKINAVLPTASAADFYLQEFENEHCSFISLARKLLIDDILTELRTNALSVISLSLGPFTVDLLLPELDYDEEDHTALSFGHHALTANSGRSLNDYHWLESPVSERTVTLGNESMKDRLLVAYSATFQAMIEAETARVEAKEVLQSRTTHKDKETYKRTGKLLLAGFLLLLLINFLLFMIYSPYSSSLPANLPATQTALETLRSEVEARESLLQTLGWEGNTGIAYLADQIASSVPNGISLTLLSFNPMDQQQTRRDRMPVFQNGIIQISGNCNAVGDLNQWVGQLKELPFSDVVAVTSYQFNEREEQGNFILSVTIQ